MTPLHFEGRWILITGASSGLGREMAYQLARKHKANLFLVARRRELLAAMREDIHDYSGVQIEILVADLSLPEEVDRLMDQVIGTGKLYGAVLNAGITYFGQQTALPDSEFQRILQVNLISVTRMTTRLVKHFEDTRTEGGVMLVSSMAGYLPTPFQAVYSATKAFLINFASALQYEIQNPALSITLFEPGGIATEMTQGDNFNDLRGWLMPVDQAAGKAIEAFKKRRYHAIPGFSNKMGFFFSRIVPRTFLVHQLGKVYGKALSAHENRKA